MMSELFILNNRSELLVRKVFKHERTSCSPVAAFCKVLDEVKAGHKPPHFLEEGYHLYYICPSNLYLVAAFVNYVEPIVVIEFLTRPAEDTVDASGEIILSTCEDILSKVLHMMKDYLGLVTEDSVRANSLLAFEIVSEVMDGGYIQVTSTKQIQPFILSQPLIAAKPVLASDEVASRIFGIDSRISTALAEHSFKAPSLQGSHLQAGQIYIDIWEDLTAVISANGETSHIKVEGAVHIHANIPGYTHVQMKLNEDLQVVRPGQQGAFGCSVQLSHYKLHQNVDTGQFETKRVLRITPTAGEFSAITYTVEPKSVKLPIEIKAMIADIPGSRDVSLTIKASLDHTLLPQSAHAIRLVMEIPVPDKVTSISQTVTGPSQHLELKEGRIRWSVGKLTTEEPSLAVIRLVSQSGQALTRRDIGPVTAVFELACLTLSGLQVSSIKVCEGKKRKPVERFVRWRTTSSSFTVLTS